MGKNHTPTDDLASAAATMGCGSSMQPVECEGYMHDHARPKFSAECEAEKDLDPERFAKLFKSYDKDQDGLLSPAECSDIMVHGLEGCVTYYKTQIESAIVSGKYTLFGTADGQELPDQDKPETWTSREVRKVMNGIAAERNALKAAEEKVESYKEEMSDPVDRGVEIHKMFTTPEGNGPAPDLNLERFTQIMIVTLDSLYESSQRALMSPYN